MDMTMSEKEVFNSKYDKQFIYNEHGLTRWDIIVCSWIANVRNKPEGYRCAYDLWAYGCPEWAIRAVCDITGLKPLKYVMQ